MCLLSATPTTCTSGAVDTQIRRTHHRANALLNSHCIKRKRSAAFKAFKGLPPYVTSLLQPSEASVKS